MNSANNSRNSNQIPINSNATNLRNGNSGINFNRKGRLARIAPLGVGSLVLLSLAPAVIKSGNVDPGSETPTPTTLLPVDERSLWGAAEDELVLSGFEDPTNEQITLLTDKALKLNKAADHEFDPNNLLPGQQVIVPLVEDIVERHP